MSERQERQAREGWLYGLAAYGWWGLVPLYFASIAAVPPLEVLAHRVVWSVLVLTVLLQAGSRWRALAACFRSPRLLAALGFTSLLIAVNWLMYIYSVVSQQINQSSLGYYITPLVSVVLGLVFYRERLRTLQWIAVALAAYGVLSLTQAVGTVPLIALSLAFSFSFYGLVRKALPVDGVLGLAVETFLLLPFAAGYLGYLAVRGEATFAGGGGQFDLLLALSGIVTTVPLICFGQAARRLPLSTLGFLQYLAPTIQFVLALGYFGELRDANWILSFIFIWSALAVFSLDSIRAYRRRPLSGEA